MIEHCIHIWETSLAKSYTGYLEEAKIALEEHQEQEVKKRDGNHIGLVVYSLVPRLSLTT